MGRRVIRTDPEAGSAAKKDHINLLSLLASNPPIGHYVGRKYTDVVAELKEKKVLKINQDGRGRIQRKRTWNHSHLRQVRLMISQKPAQLLNVAKKVTSAYTSYIGSSLEFGKE